jgi:hypothetical protein
MSKMSGDTARFFRMRKQRNVRRARAEALRLEIVARKAVPDALTEKPKP